MIPQNAFPRPQREPEGVAILVVIPILLFVSLIGLFMLYIVQSKLESTTMVVQAKQAKYLAHSAAQLAILEFQERTQLSSNARQGSSTIEVLAPETLPSNGTLFLPDHTPRMFFGFSKSGAVLTLDTPIRSNLPIGSSLYLCRDLDGDGQFGSIGPILFGAGVMRAARSAVEMGDDGEPADEGGGDDAQPDGPAQGNPQGRGGDQGRGHGRDGGPPGWQGGGGQDDDEGETQPGAFNFGPPVLYVRGTARVGPAESAHGSALTFR